MKSVPQNSQLWIHVACSVFERIVWKFVDYSIHLCRGRSHRTSIVQPNCQHHAVDRENLLMSKELIKYFNMSKNLNLAQSWHSLWDKPEKYFLADKLMQVSLLVQLKRSSFCLSRWKLILKRLNFMIHGYSLMQ